MMKLGIRNDDCPFHMIWQFLVLFERGDAELGSDLCSSFGNWIDDPYQLDARMALQKASMNSPKMPCPNDCDP
jgi:hypothetical protein